MAKEKKLIPKSSKKDFFYEISGTLAILLCLILLSELGTVGTVLKILSKVIFGDFYFIVIFYIIVSGIIALVKEKWFDFRSLRFNGIILFMLSLFMLIHISFLSLYNITSNSILSTTIDIYKEKIFNNEAILSYGGGIIGGILTQIFVVLFNRLGTIIFGIMFIILSISMITNLSISSFFLAVRYLFGKTKKISLVIYRYFANINYPSKKSRIRERNLLINLNLLTDVINQPNDLFALKIANDERDMIIAMIYQMNGYINSDKILIGYANNRYIFVGNFSSININKIETLLNRRCIIYNENNRLIIEVGSKIKKLLSLKALLLLNNSFDIPIGIEINSQILYFNPIINQNILISGDEESGVKTFIKSFIITLFFRLKDKFNLIICDFKDEFNDLKLLPNLYYPLTKKIEIFDDLLDELSNELEKRLNILNEYECDNYINLNKILEQKKLKEMLPIYFVINTLGYINDKGSSQKLIYFLKFGYKVGIHLILVSKESIINSNIVSNTKTKICLKTAVLEKSYSILGNKNACNLNGNGDSLLVLDLEIFHIQLPYISDSDYKRVINKIILH